jgi:hypothetical protein
VRAEPGVQTHDPDPVQATPGEHVRDGFARPGPAQLLAQPEDPRTGAKDAWLCVELLADVEERVVLADPDLRHVRLVAAPAARPRAWRECRYREDAARRRRHPRREVPAAAPPARRNRHAKRVRAVPHDPAPGASGGLSGSVRTAGASGLASLSASVSAAISIAATAASPTIESARRAPMRRVRGGGGVSVHWIEARLGVQLSSVGSGSCA